MRDLLLLAILLLVSVAKPLRPGGVSAVAAESLLLNRKCRLLFSPSGICRKLGPKGPSPEVIAAIIDMETRNPKFGYSDRARQGSLGAARSLGPSRIVGDAAPAA